MSDRQLRDELERTQAELSRARAELEEARARDAELDAWRARAEDAERLLARVIDRFAPTPKEKQALREELLAEDFDRAKTRGSKVDLLPF